MVTKTINPIHFEDLEPHRFEDLIRQLIYNFKDWSSLEATGKLGTDDGIDIRGFEKIQKRIEYLSEENEESEEIYDERLWFVQCKREKSITPTKIKRIIEESFISEVPEGYILAAACDFSKKTRDIFREEMQNYKIKEFYLWGKAELEDMLYQEKNDSILFTFFGYSIHLKQKNEVSSIRKMITIKGKLKSLIDGSDKKAGEGIVIKEIDDDGYLRSREDYFYIKENFFHNGILVVLGRYHAYVDSEKMEFDYDEKNKFYKPYNPRIENNKNIRSDDIEVPKDKVGFVEIFGLLPYDSILEIDKYGNYESDYKPIVIVKDKEIIYKKRRFILEKGEVDIYRRDYQDVRLYKRIDYFNKKRKNKK